MSRADLKFKMSRIQQKNRKINFGFVQIGSRFNCKGSIPNNEGEKTCASIDEIFQAKTFKTAWI